MSATYCPHCRRVTNTRRVLEPPRRTKEPGRQVLHCALCNGFIRSEEVPRAAAKDSVP